MEFPLSTRIHDEGDSVVVTVSGDVDMAVADPFSSALATAIENATRAVVLDLADLRFMDSTGVRALLYAQHNASANDLTFHIRNPSETVRRVLEVCGVLHTIR